MPNRPDPKVQRSPYHLTTASIDWGSDNVPRSSDYGDVYYSREQGLAETRHVFLDNNRLVKRWRELSPGAVFTIAETGFGTGLNFLAAWQLWREYAPEGARLHFISIEKHPMRSADLTRALSNWPELAPLGEQLLEQYPPAIPGYHRLLFEQRQVVLDLIFDDAGQGLGALPASNHPNFMATGGKVDAWFLDGFAPGKNPGMWSPALFDAVAALSGPGTTFATFTAAGDVKRGLQDRGFIVEKVTGFGRKRDMLRGTLTGEQRPAPMADQPRENAAWHVTPSPHLNRGKHVVVLGAGLAGCHTARALAERGLQVTILERHGVPAAEASGNPQGILYTKLSHQAGLLNRFALQSFLFALRYYRAFPDLPGDLCGVLQLAHSAQERAALEKIRNAFSGSGDTVQFLDADAASAVAGIPLQHPAVYFPGAGWLRPQALCRQLAEHPNITLRTGCEVQYFSYSGGRWEVDASPEPADALVVATGAAAGSLEQLQALPLKAVRGQLSYLDTDQLAAMPRCVICHDGYIAPALDTGFVIGASFDTRSDDLALRESEHADNLDKLAAAIPALAASQAQISGGRAALRCTSRDYLPLIGPMPDVAMMRQRFAPLAKNAKSFIATEAPYHPALYVNLAHGSRGLTSTPLAAELIASHLCGEISPLPRELVRALSPARFVIRDIIRNSAAFLLPGT